MDLRWDGTGPPDLLEYNADAATALFEAAVVQWEWLTCIAPELDQFNSIHETLLAAWSALGLPRRVQFACARGSAEDRGTLDYLRDTAVQAGLDAPFLFMDEIGWNGQGFRDMRERPIEVLFKLYPWDWLLTEEFGRHLTRSGTRWIEPAWRMLPASKGFLALLWELFPGRPDLLPAVREPGRISGPEIGKPFWGREGADLLTSDGAQTPDPTAISQVSGSNGLNCLASVVAFRCWEAGWSPGRPAG